MKKRFFQILKIWGNVIKNIRMFFLLCFICKTTLVSNSTDNSIQWMTYQADFSNKHNKMISWMRMEKRLFRLNNVTTMFQIHFDLDGKTETKRIITRTVATALLLIIEAWMSLSWNSLGWWWLMMWFTQHHNLSSTSAPISINLDLLPQLPLTNSFVASGTIAIIFLHYRVFLSVLANPSAFTFCQSDKFECKSSVNVTFPLDKCSIVENTSPTPCAPPDP